MAKRTTGEGGFFHDEKRGIWIYQIRYTDSNGKRGRKKFAAKTKREALQKGKDFLENIQSGMDSDYTQMTVRMWVSRWLEEYARPHIRPRTYEKYQSCLSSYIVPTYGSYTLNKLSPPALQRHFNSLLVKGRRDGKGLSPSTVRATRRYFCIWMMQSKQGFFKATQSEQPSQPSF